MRLILLSAVGILLLNACAKQPPVAQAAPTSTTTAVQTTPAPPAPTLTPTAPQASSIQPTETAQSGSEMTWKYDARTGKTTTTTKTLKGRICLRQVPAPGGHIMISEQVPCN